MIAVDISEKLGCLHSFLANAASSMGRYFLGLSRARRGNSFFSRDFRQIAPSRIWHRVCITALSLCRLQNRTFFPTSPLSRLPSNSDDASRVPQLAGLGVRPCLLQESWHAVETAPHASLRPAGCTLGFSLFPPCARHPHPEKGEVSVMRIARDAAETLNAG